MAVAMRYLEPVAAYDKTGAVTDLENGLTFGYLRYRDTSRTVLGGMSHVMLDSARVVPRVALEKGYGFRYPTLDAAFQAVVSPK